MHVLCVCDVCAACVLCACCACVSLHAVLCVDVVCVSVRVCTAITIDSKVKGFPIWKRVSHKFGISKSDEFLRRLH